jgi:hypothetical protein
VFYTDVGQFVNLNYTFRINTNPYSSKALPRKIYYLKSSPYFALSLHKVIQHVLRQTTQLAKSIINHPMRRNLKSWFQMLRHKD